MLEIKRDAEVMMRVHLRSIQELREEDESCKEQAETPQSPQVSQLSRILADIEVKEYIDKLVEDYKRRQVLHEGLPLFELIAPTPPPTSFYSERLADDLGEAEYEMATQ